MSGDAKRVDVKVIYLPGQTPNVRLESNDLPVTNGVLEFSNNKHDGFWVHFNLDEASLKDYRFVQASMSPLYSALIDGNGGECPPKGVWSEFEPHDVFERTIIVRNKNKLPQGKTEQRFGFTLRVTKDHDGNGPVLDLDPGGINHNGPTAPYSKGLLLLAGAAIGVLATLGTQALLMSG